MGLPFTLLGDPWREGISNDGRFKAFAVYGDVIWHLSDRLNLTTGVRFTRDQKDFTWYNPPRQAPQFDATVAGLDQAGITAMLPPEAQYALAAFGQNVIFNPASGAPVGVLVQAHNRWTNVSPRAVLDYKFTPNVMGYVSVTKGYKAGGYNSVQIGSHFAPEHVINYEAGIKSVFPEQNLLLNGSIYHYRYNDLQALTLDPNSTGSGIPRYLVSSSDQKATGAELELQWRPLEALQIGANLAYIDDTYSRYIAPSGANLSGQPTGVPKYSYAVHAAYTWHDVFGGNVVFNLSHGYRGQSRCNSDSQLQGNCQISPNFSVGASQQRTDARLGWDAVHERWGVALFANNLFNQRYVTGVNNITTSVFGTPFASITPPRTWGVELHAKF